MSEENTNTNPESISWERNQKGLLNFVPYQYNFDGSINWRKMVKPEYLVVNRQNFERRKTEVPQSIEGLDDADLLILLGGIKDLAKLRGYTSVVHTPYATTPDYCCVKTTICWTPNFETNNQPVCFDSLADASIKNTQSFARFYLAAIAENRGFVRAVRNFLGINIAGKDEVSLIEDIENDKQKTEDNSDGSRSYLRGLVSKNKIQFESLKNRMIEAGVPGADSWEELGDIQATQVLEVASLIEKILESRKK